MEDMAFRHEQYGVKPVHYMLPWILEKAMGNGWTEEVKEAWTNCYNTIAAAMTMPLFIKVAYQHNSKAF